MKLPYESKLSASKLCGCVLRECSQIEFGEVYVTFGSPIKDSEDVQQGTLSCT